MMTAMTYLTDLIPFLLTVLAILVTAFVVFALVHLAADSRLPRALAQARSRLRRSRKNRLAPWDRPSRLA
jgi:hypothetical protein